ncbi:MAG TPA: hypothetical protein VE218_02655, partial [Acidobacteriaceae bacterium]|nr:hypothetical protein [Acidobacteriaceae bacterium]
TLLLLASIGAVHLASHAAFSVTTQSFQGAIVGWAQAATRLQLGWLAIGLLIAFVLFTVSRGLMESRQRT